MRALPICLVALMLSGCSMLSRSPVEPCSKQLHPSRKRSLQNRKRRAPRRSEFIPMQKNCRQTVPGDLGEVSGDSCQASNQDSPPSIPTARKRMQINASKMKANAVLLHSCEVTSGTPGCYRQAVCIGSALNITAK